MIAFEAIGTFHSQSTHPFEAPRQPSVDSANSMGEIRLFANKDYEQAVRDLEGFERIWVLYQFHHNAEWKPMVMPPRGPRIKRGVFATRAPYRPNAIGMSCVRLIKVEGLSVIVEGHDLLEGTPILDIKPYLPYADAFPESKVGWLETVEGDRWQVSLSAQATQQLEWLEDKGLSQLRGFLLSQLEYDPTDHKRKRVDVREDGFLIAYRTWRAHFTLDENTRALKVDSILSGYSQVHLQETEDRYGDKDLHREFVKKWLILKP